MSQRNFDFVTHGIERISFEHTSIQSYLERIEQNFLKLIQEDKEYRKLWEFDIQPYPFTQERGYDPDLGLIERSGNNGKDNKFFLHDTNRSLRVLLGLRGVAISKHEQLLSGVEVLQSVVHNQVIKFAQKLDQRFPGKNFAEGIQKAQFLNKLRLIAYPKPDEINTVEHIIAREHTDRDLITTHIYESSPGLMFKLHNGEEHQYEQQPGSTVVFPGKKLQAATGGVFTEEPREGGKVEIIATGGDIKATPHYVKALPFREGMDYRVSMVYFAHIPDVDVPHMK